jgi:hypothetical protein
MCVVDIYVVTAHWITVKSFPHPIACVEQFHLLFLEQLGRKLDKRNYALKEGCNLRFYLRSIRYSEDMDLDVQSTPVEVLGDRVEQILSGSTVLTHGKMLPKAGDIKSSLPHDSGYRAQ